MSRPKVLLVDDEPGIRFGLSAYLDAHGIEAVEAETCEEAERLFRGAPPDAVVCDYSLPDGDALYLLPRFRLLEPDVPVIVLTGRASIDLAVRAMKEGAEHFLTKPVESSALLLVVQRSLDHRRTRRRLAGAVTARPEERNPFVGTSKAIADLAELARRLAATEGTVLIRGETGTGKGVLARWLHDNGPRRQEPYVDLNCAGLSRDFLETELFGHEKGAFTGAIATKQGLFDVAHNGTLFLDEIGDVDPSVQPKLLKVIEEKRYRRLGDTRDRQSDTRLVAATHQDLAQLVRERRFREDLFYRVNAFLLAIPPLRARPEDIPLLTRALLVEIAPHTAHRNLFLSPDAEEALARYAWPGNVRELRNVLERAAVVASSERVTADDLHLGDQAARQSFGAHEHAARQGFGAHQRASEPSAGPGESDGLTLEEVETRHIERVLALCNGSVDEAAIRLAIPRSTLYVRLKRLRQRGG
jgi:DNA-binding NtrC family response regulator